MGSTASGASASAIIPWAAMTRNTPAVPIRMAAPDQEAGSVDDRNGEDSAAEFVGVDPFQHTANDLDAVDLVAVDRCVEPDGGAIVSTVHDHQRHRHRRTGGQTRDGQLGPPDRSPANRDGADHEGITHSVRPGGSTRPRFCATADRGGLAWR